MDNCNPTEELLKESTSLDPKEMTTEDYMKVFKKFAFPFKLHAMLEEAEKDNFTDVVSWQSHGKAFRVHKTKEFTSTILPVYFEKSKYRSFQRQLHIYGFKRIRNKASKDHNSYYHSLFQKGNIKLCLEMKREKIKGVKDKDEDKEGTLVAPAPDFYREIDTQPFEPVLSSPSKDFHDSHQTLSTSPRKITHESLRAMLEPISNALDIQPPIESSSSIDWLQQAHKILSNDSVKTSQQIPQLQVPPYTSIPQPSPTYPNSFPNPQMMQSMTNPLFGCIINPHGGFPLLVNSNILPSSSLSSSVTTSFGGNTPIQKALFKQQTTARQNNNNNNLLVNALPGPLQQPQQQQVNGSVVPPPTNNNMMMGQQKFLQGEGKESDFGGKKFFFTD